MVVPDIGSQGRVCPSLQEKRDGIRVAIVTSINESSDSALKERDGKKIKDLIHCSGD
jgi:hypothetical protein